MVTYGIFEKYTPDQFPEGMPPELAKSVLFLRNSNGQDWYELQKELPSGGVFIGLHPDGMISMVDTDPTRLVPQGVELIYLDEVPEGLPEDPHNRLGMMYNKETGIVTPSPYKTGRIVSVLEFKEQFTQEERISLRRLAKDDELMEDWFDLLNAAQYVDLDDPRTVGGVDYLVSKGVLTQERADALLKR